jgi:leader peptidase (prepilin peptidase)/N-methyltransferase
VSPEWIWLIFIFAFGSCVGSFLNVVIYRLPREKSLVTPPSTCPECNRRIKFYDNIPLISWIFLRGRCRYCKTRISPRYFVIELLTALLFVGVFVFYFSGNYRQIGIEATTAIGKFLAGGWFFYLTVMVLLTAFLAASAIDLELWIIPLVICWFVSLVGVLSASLGGFVIPPAIIWTYELFPSASPGIGAMAAGATVGLIISLILLWAGVIKTSYPVEEHQEQEGPQNPEQEPEYNHRLEVMKEVVFVLPMIIGPIVAYWLAKNTALGRDWWDNFSQLPVITGLLGSLWGYFIGGAVVWATRILGTLLFGKEAMGLGDVHLMAAAGTVIGPVFVVIAFFVAPFFGLAWAGYQMLFKKTRQIPYGPFLSLGVFAVMIFHDWIRDYISMLYMYN